MDVQQILWQTSHTFIARLKVMVIGLTPANSSNVFCVTINIESGEATYLKTIK